jgi:hypothetical protein
MKDLRGCPEKGTGSILFGTAIAHIQQYVTR